MSKVITILVVFITFCFLGWCLELIYRSYKNRHLTNPGFMQGCVLPLYGSGGTILYLICNLNLHIESLAVDIVVKCLIGTILMTIIEYIAGIMSLKFYHTRLWDYSKRWGNIQGIICPLFSFFWGLLTVFFYFVFVYTNFLNSFGNFIYSNVLLVFLFGIFYGIFIVDLFHSLSLLDKIKAYAIKIKENIHFEEFKDNILTKGQNAKIKFIDNFKSNKHIAQFIEKVNQYKENKKKD